MANEEPQPEIVTPSIQKNEMRQLAQIVKGLEAMGPRARWAAIRWIIERYNANRESK